MITLIIIITTVICSLLAIKERSLFYRFALNPYSVYKYKQWYRVVTHAFIHVDFMHLFVNMFVLWSFGTSIENAFKYYQLQELIINPDISFLMLYFGGVLFSTIPDLKSKRSFPLYNSVGASGGVAAVLFASIFISPWSNLYLFLFIPIPQIIFGVLYVVYSNYMDKRSNSYVNHKAHLVGAIYGFLFMITQNIDFITIFIDNFLP